MASDCVSCHTVPGSDRPFAGGREIQTPFGNIVAPNITPDRDTGIGAWSDAEFDAAVRKGVRRAGGLLYPAMPYNAFTKLSRDDVLAIRAYLNTVTPVSNAVRDPVKQGAYPVTLGHCMECHSTWQRAVSDHINGLGKGGRPFTPALVKGFATTWDGAKARNITSHKTAGIDAWSDEEIKRAITQGVRPDGTRLKPPMDFSSYAKMTNTDLEAIVAYLRTVPRLSEARKPV